MSHEERVRFAILGELHQVAETIVTVRPTIPRADQSQWAVDQMTMAVKRYPNLAPTVIAYYLGVMVGAAEESAGLGVH